MSVFPDERLECVWVILGKCVLDLAVGDEVRAFGNSVIELSPDGQVVADTGSDELDPRCGRGLPDPRNRVEGVSADVVVGAVVEFLGGRVVLRRTDSAVDGHNPSLAERTSATSER